MSKKRKKSHLTPAIDVLQGLLQNPNFPLARQFTRWKVWNSWESIVGKSIAKYTTPVGYLKGQLYIWVKHPTQIQELIFVTQALQNKINKFIGKKWVRSIRFTLNRSNVPEQAAISNDVRKLLS